jgi:hypothetical protein
MAAKKPGSLFRAPTVEDVPTPPAAETGAPKRGKHLISGMFEPAAYRQFGVLAAELGVNKQDLLREALNDLFVKHGKPPIA